MSGSAKCKSAVVPQSIALDMRKGNDLPPSLSDPVRFNILLRSEGHQLWVKVVKV